jgi:hypothetical protein
MDKNNTKKYNKYNEISLEALYLKYNVTKYYIRQCISGRKTGLLADSIMKDYKIMEMERKQIVNNLINKTL